MAAAVSPASSLARARFAVAPAIAARSPSSRHALTLCPRRSVAISWRPASEAASPARSSSPAPSTGSLRHAACLFEEREGLVVGAQRDGPLGGSPERDPGLPGQGVGLRSRGRIGVGGEVVTGQAARELVGPEALEEPGRREVAGLAVLPGEGVVGDLADEGLDERVLAALR